MSITQLYPAEVENASHADKITPLYPTKVGNASHADRVKLSCSCGHEGTVSISAIEARFPGYEPVNSIKQVVRCRVCKAKGDFEVECGVPLGYDEPC